MENFAQMVREWAPWQIEEAVQLLQRRKEEQQGHPPLDQEQTEQQELEREKSADNDNRPAVNGTATDTDAAAKAASAAIAMALRHAPTASTSATTGADTEEQDEAKRQERAVCEDPSDEDVPLALLYKRCLRPQKERVKGQEEANAKHQELVSTPSVKDLGSNQRSPLCRGENKSENHSGLHNNDSAPLAAAVAPRGLASFGFVSATRRSGGSACDKNRLITAFVQDKRIVPRALRFWGAPDTPPPSPPIPPHAPPALSSHRGAPVVVVDENSSSLLHSPVVCAMGDGDAHPAPERPRYKSFADMIDAATAAAQTKNSEAVSGRGCSCPFHVRLPAPRSGFCDEVIFCGFYAIGYDPCQSRPPYFGTHNGHDALSPAELLRLARFAPGEAMPRLSTLDYDYDSGDDWDVVEGDEDIGASSSGEDDDEEDGDSSSLRESELDFINDGAVGEGEDEDEDAELQRKMMEARQRRANRLRHKEKLVPAFSGPFAGVALLDHPLRAFDRFERLTPAMAGGPALAALLQPELIAMERAAGERDENEGERQQRLVEAALRNRREMTSGELDAVHALVAANARITPRAIVDALLEQQWCAGVTRAEIMRTIRRYYESHHKRLVRRQEPWAATDERLFAKQQKLPLPAKGMRTGGNGRGRDAANATSGRARSGEENNEDEENNEEEENDDGCGSGNDSSDEALVVDLLRKRQRDADEPTGTAAATAANE